MALELVILIGIQASGKTTFYRRRLAERYLHVSLDNWRGKENVRKKEFQAISAGLESALASGGRTRGVTVDNTNTTILTRRRYFDYAGQFAAAHGCQVRLIAYCFAADLEACLARNAQRPLDAPVGCGYFVPPDAIASYHRQFQDASFDEGFAEIYDVAIGPDGQFVVANRADKA